MKPGNIFYKQQSMRCSSLIPLSHPQIKITFIFHIYWFPDFHICKLKSLSCFMILNSQVPAISPTATSSWCSASYGVSSGSIRLGASRNCRQRSWCLRGSMPFCIHISRCITSIVIGMMVSRCSKFYRFFFIEGRVSILKGTPRPIFQKVVKST